MPHLCPRPCSRLATAAVFISVGVVQFIIGIILLRSKYVYLLAGPDFWTSSCNVAVGCVLGVTASVWKNSKKRRLSKKHFVRRNLLLALLFSALIINMTTLGIFLLGEGNTLLSIRLENGRKYDETTFASEVLAYAYVTSVCCPIVCIVITIVSMSGSFFKYAAAKKSSLETKAVVNASKKERLHPPRWVYTSELLDSSKKKIREFILTSSSESEDDAKYGSSYHKYSSSSEDVQHVLSRMAQGKRDSMLSDSAIMLREMDIRRKHKHNEVDKDGSYVGPMLQRARESILGERQPREQCLIQDELTLARVKKPQKDYSSLDGNSCLPSNEPSMKRMKYLKSKQFNTSYKNSHNSEDLANEYQKASSKMLKHYPSQYKKNRGKLRSASDVSDRAISDFAEIHKRPRMSEVELELRDLPSEYKNKRKSVKIQENKSFEETSPSYCLSPDGSDFESDSIFETSRRSSWAGEIVPINTKQLSGLKLSRKLIPVANPVVPPAVKMHIVPKISDDSGIGSVASNTFNEVPNCDYKNRKSLGSFQEELAVLNKDDAQEYPKMGSQNAKKYDNKIEKMASISEESNIEMRNRSEETPEFDSQDAIDLSSWKSYTGKKSFESAKDKIRDRMNARRDTTMKRKAGTSSKAIRRIWSMAMSENRSDFQDQVVDEDSLIGLSEEELIARQLRTRSIRKVVQQRMREKIGM